MDDWAQPIATSLYEMHNNWLLHLAIDNAKEHHPKIPTLRFMLSQFCYGEDIAGSIQIEAKMMCAVRMLEQHKIRCDSAGNDLQVMYPAIRFKVVRIGFIQPDQMQGIVQPIRDSIIWQPVSINKSGTGSLNSPVSLLV